MRDKNRYLFERGNRRAYVRRVPGHVAHLDSRSRIQISLKTNSLEAARVRRDRLEEAGDLYWSSLLAGGGSDDRTVASIADCASGHCGWMDTKRYSMGE